MEYDSGRYHRHELLDGIGPDGVAKIRRGKALVVGCGGLGSTVLPLLVAAGVGKLTFADEDLVETSNLARQIAYGEADVGRPKVEAMADRLRALNSEVRLVPVRRRLDERTLSTLIPGNDVVLDCTDNVGSRAAINEACCMYKVPLVFGAVAYFTGQLTLFNFKDPFSPCYACLFPSAAKFDAAVSGSPSGPTAVWSPLVAMVGAMQANEALRLLVGSKLNLEGKLRIFDLSRNTTVDYSVRKDKRCPVCSAFLRA